MKLRTARARAVTEQGTWACAVVLTWLRYCLIVMVLSGGGDDIAISHNDRQFQLLAKDGGMLVPARPTNLEHQGLVVPWRLW